MPNFKKISSKISELTISNPKKATNKIKWTNIINAGQPEIDYLKKNYKFNLDHLEASIATVFSQRPLIYGEKYYFFIILHFPILIDNRITAGEIEFFIGHEFLVTVHNNIPAVNEIFEMAKNNDNSLLSHNLESSVILLYDLLNKLINDCYVLIDSNSISLSKIDELIFSGKQREVVNLILNIRRNIINLRKILQNHGYILKKLTEVKSSLVPQKEIKEHYNILVEHSERIWSMLDNQKEMVDVLNDTNESKLSSQMTRVMRTLTIFSGMVFPLTLIATIFGMNTKYMPLINHPNGFWIVISLMAVCALFMLSIFKRRHWL